MKTDSTGWHFDVTAEPLLVPQELLEYGASGKVLAESMITFFCSLMASLSLHAVLQIFELYGYAIRSRLRKDVTYPWVQL